MIVIDSFHRLTTRVIVDDSISVSCFSQNRQAHSYNSELKMAAKTPRREENDKDLSSSEEVGSDDAEGPPNNNRRRSNKSNICCLHFHSATPGTRSSRETYLREKHLYDTAMVDY